MRSYKAQVLPGKEREFLLLTARRTNCIICIRIQNPYVPLKKDEASAAERRALAAVNDAAQPSLICLFTKHDKYIDFPKKALMHLIYRSFDIFLLEHVQQKCR